VIRNPEIEYKITEIKSLLEQLNNLEAEINALQTEWDSSCRKTGDTRITGAYSQFNELLNQIKDKKGELAVLKRDAKKVSVPAWDKVGLKCF